MIFHQQQLRSMPLQAEAAEHIELRSFDVHRHEIDFRIACLGENRIKRHHSYNFSAHIFRGGIDEIFDQAGVAEAFRGVKS